VTDEASAAAAVRAAIGGEALVVHAAAPRAILDRLYDDLRRLGPVTVRAGAASQPEPPAGRLSAEERKLIDLLATGRTVRDAAIELHISRRTADRRLRSARAALGVATTIEAIVATRSPTG
jgi:DNA-binding NarL/FixJ family response regulator